MSVKQFLYIRQYHGENQSWDTLEFSSMALNALPKQSEDFPGWYQAIIREADLAENGLARGTMVIKPWGYAIWEQIQRAVDERIKDLDHENLYFPTLIPQSLLEREADHVEGFAPEVIAATHAGGKELEEALILRPTSETVIWETYSKWIQSYRDLPLLYNQWANVFRAEMRSRIFLRTSEFLWQEGHTAHETKEEAIREAATIMRDVYASTIVNVLKIPGVVGRKSETERFPGADESITFETMMRDKKALQSCTSHYLGQNFAKAYGVQFQSRSGSLEYAFATSWGISTRIVGGVIMAHGDDKGLRLPSAVAPKQIVIVPIYKTDDERTEVLEKAQQIKYDFKVKGIRVKIDDRDEYRPGYKFNEWEQKGVPIRVELGPRDIEAGTALVSIRTQEGKQKVAFDSLVDDLITMLGSYDDTLYSEALAFRESNIFRPNNYEEMKEFLNDGGGLALVPWDGDAKSELQVKNETKATIRCLPMSDLELTQTVETGEFTKGQVDDGAKCIISGNDATEMALFSQAY